MFLGIDLGTSSIKTILINENQDTIASHTENIEIANPKSGYYEQNPEDWFLSTINCFRKIKDLKPKEFSSVKSIGISGQMHGATILDKNNRVLRPCILWNDTRAAKECILMEQKYLDLRKESGNIAMPGFTSPKILWLKNNEKDMFNNIAKVLLPKDYLRFRLSNSFVTDMSDASGTLWLNVRERKWSENLLNLTELSQNNMPDLVEGSEVSSFIDKNLANELGFKNKVIIAGGAGDQAAGAIGSGVINNNQSVISIGTSGVYFSPTQDFIPNTSKAVHSFCHCIPNTWHHMSVMLSATSSINWATKIFNLDIDKAMKMVEDYFNNDFIIKSTPYFLPYLTGERTPYNNPHLRGSFHMLDTSTNVDALLYSVIEGISFGIKDGFDAVHAVSPNKDETYLVGGGSKSTFWTSFISSMLKQKILLGRDADLGPALGVARLAMLATKEYNKDDILKSMPIIVELKPNEKSSIILDKRYKTWKEIVKHNEPISKKIMEKNYE